MAKRDRITVQTSSERHEIIATRDGGTVEHLPADRTRPMHIFIELNAAHPPTEITSLHVAPEEVKWIKRDTISLQEWRDRK